MKLARARECYEYFSGKASDLVRTSALAGIGVVWVFNVATPEKALDLPKPLVAVTFLLVVTLAFDLLQYVYASFAWARLHRVSELAHQKQQQAARDAARNPRRLGQQPLEVAEYDDYEVSVPSWINVPTNVFFWSKMGTLLIAYLLLAIFVSRFFLTSG